MTSSGNACSSHRPARASIRLLLLALAPVLLSACAAPLPPLQWVRLPVEPPGIDGGVRGEAVSSARPGEAASRAAAGEDGAWRLLSLELPGHLDRDALLVPQGRAGLRALEGVRWAEPLRDAVPRLLRHDLALLLGVPVWGYAVPPGASPARSLSLEILGFDVAPDGRGVAVHARWRLSAVAAAVPAASAARTAPSAPAPVAGRADLARVGEAVFVTPAEGDDADALVLAHRRGIRELAARIAASARR